MKSLVSLVVPPFLSVVRPSLAASALKASLQRANINASAKYVNLWFAESIDPQLNEWIAVASDCRWLLGEWIFSQVLDRSTRTNEEGYIESVLTGVPRQLIDKLREVRRQAAPFAKKAALNLLAEKPTIIGFSTSFQQNCAALAIAREIKALEPGIVICFGGANCEGAMGQALLSAFPQIDLVFSGESDVMFPQFVREYLSSDGRSRSVIERQVFSSIPVADLDSLPVPDFSDYFETLSQMSFREAVRPGLLFESSRGCWWGAKHHCKFCGLNGNTMAYRRKSPSRVLSELSEQYAKWNLTHFEAVDNILDTKHIDSVLGVLATEKAPYKLFYEIKSNLNHQQLSTLANGGVIRSTNLSPDGKPMFAAEVGDALLPQLKSINEVSNVWDDPAIEPAILATTADSPCSYDAVGDTDAVGRKLRANDVWQTGQRGSGIIVAICDNGIDKARYPVVDGWSPIADCPWGQEQDGWAVGHGSMCAHSALIAAPDAKLLDIGVLKYSNADRTAWLSDAIVGLNWAINWARNQDSFKIVFSISWATYRSLPDDGLVGSYRNSPNHPFNRRVRSIVSEGHAMVFAAGNCGLPCPDLRCGENDRGPGKSIWGANSLEEVLTVTAVDLNDKRIGYSSEGPGLICKQKPDVAAYANFKGHFDVDLGTSTAAPVAAGAVALLMSAVPGADYQKVKQSLLSTARTFGAPGWNQELGYGIVDCKAAYDWLQQRS